MVERELGPDTKIKRIENGGTNSDGSLGSFEITTEDGKSHHFWCAANNLPDMAANLLTLAQFIAEKSGGLKEASGEAIVNAGATTAIQFGLASGRTAQEVILAVHIGISRPIVFSVSPNVLGGLRNLLNERLVDTPYPVRRN
ncbi:MAG: hypothetical protein ABIL01_28670 [Pseudomonadota bacterium]